MGNVAKNELVAAKHHYSLAACHFQLKLLDTKVDNHDSLQYFLLSIAIMMMKDEGLTSYTYTLGCVKNLESFSTSSTQYIGTSEEYGDTQMYSCTY